MVFNANFNNISAILWRSVLLVEETGVPKENHQPTANHWQNFNYRMLLRVQLAWARFEFITFSGDTHCLLCIQLPYDHDYDDT